MKEIILSQNKIALVDDEDYEWLIKYKWTAMKGKNTYYAYRNSYKSNKICHIKMHRLIMKVTDPKIHIDHIDHNGLNNQKTNLRLVTPRQNSQNRRNPGTSKFPGVSWSRYHKKWQSHIRINGKSTYLGYFNSEEDAYKAYLDACQLDKENSTLRKIVIDLHWMGRRYADMRSSYVTSLFNQHTKDLLDLGIKLNPTADEIIWARDSMGRDYDHLTDNQATPHTREARGIASNEANS